MSEMKEIALSIWVGLHPDTLEVVRELLTLFGVRTGRPAAPVEVPVEAPAVAELPVVAEKPVEELPAKKVVENAPAYSFEDVKRAIDNMAARTASHIFPPIAADDTKSQNQWLVKCVKAVKDLCRAEFGVDKPSLVPDGKRWRLIQEIDGAMLDGPGTGISFGAAISTRIAELQTQPKP